MRAAEHSPQFREKERFYEGILNPKEFERNYILRCYEPSEEMVPFVEHYFISRRRSNFDPNYVGHDVLSQPVISLFIQPEGAFFYGPTTGKRTLHAQDAPMYVGAQFKPGGFYPFWGKKVAELAEKSISANDVIAGASDVFNHTLLLKDDMHILATIDSVLRAKKPSQLPSVDLIGQIIDYIERECNQATVASVAEHFAISERTLQQLFQIYVGVGVKWAIMRARFLEVTKYARDREIKVDWTTIASDFGYSDQSHFINDFKKIVGMSPRQYVKMLG